MSPGVRVGGPGKEFVQSGVGDVPHPVCNRAQHFTVRRGEGSRYLLGASPTAVLASVAVSVAVVSGTSPAGAVNKDSARASTASIWAGTPRRYSFARALIRRLLEPDCLGRAEVDSLFDASPLVVGDVFFQKFDDGVVVVLIENGRCQDDARPSPDTLLAAHSDLGGHVFFSFVQRRPANRERTRPIASCPSVCRFAQVNRRQQRFEYGEVLATIG
jgi:hypothetical protein